MMEFSIVQERVAIKIRFQRFSSTLTDIPIVEVKDLLLIGLTILKILIINQ